MVLAGLVGVVFRLNVMAMRHVSVVSGLLMVTRFVMLGSRPVVLGSVFVMVGSFVMVLSGFF
jgi:hypothetical protein